MNRREFLKLCAATLGLGALVGAGKSVLSQIAQSQIQPLPTNNRWKAFQEGQDFDLFALGDMGTGWKVQYDLIKQISVVAGLEPNVLLLGDIIYPSAKADLIDSCITKPFLPLLQKNCKMFPLWGNHDWMEQKAIYLKQYFAAPDYYQFRIGPAEFWNLNSNQFDSEQADWLKRSLAQSQARWKIVSLHHSPYSSGQVHHNNEGLIKNLTPILAKHGVQLCLSGHNHLYERSKPINGVVYITSGGGSASLHKYTEDNPNTAYIKSTHHYLHISGNLQKLTVEAIDEKGKLIDSLSLK